MKVSVIICCYNSASRIFDTVKHICRQEYNPGTDLEIIVVDNGSTDNTVQMIHQTFVEYNEKSIPWSIIREPKPGLGHARRAGVLASSSDLIVFVDDDNHLDCNYIAMATEVMNQNQTIGVLGGDNAPLFESDIPAWYYTYAPFFAVGVQGLKSGDVSRRGYIWGAGMVLRRQLIHHIFSHGGGLALLGRTKTATLAGDDSEICKWYLLAGYTLEYDERLKLDHLMPAGRLEKDILERTLNTGASSVAVLRVYEVLVLFLNPQFRNRLLISEKLKLIIRGGSSLLRIERATIYKILKNTRLARRARPS